MSPHTVRRSWTKKHLSIQWKHMHSLSQMRGQTLQKFAESQGLGTTRELQGYLSSQLKSFFISRCINNIVNEGRPHSMSSLLHGWSGCQPQEGYGKNPSGKQAQNIKLEIKICHKPPEIKCNVWKPNIHKTEQTAYRAVKLYLNTIFVEKILLPVLNNHR